MMQRYGKLMGGILLVAGTTIGAAMLAMPISIGMAGFFPGVLLCFLCWLYFTYTALLMLEVNLWMEDEEVNLITMAKKTIGFGGEVFAWVAYLFLLYALTTAYIAGSGDAMVNFIQALTGLTLPSWLGPIPIMFIFGFFLYHGTRHVDLFNRALMIGLGVTFTFMIFGLIPYVELNKLLHVDWPPLLIGVSVVVTSFGYHIIIPSLTHYFHGDLYQMRRAIIIGSFFPLLVYILWIFVCLGIIPLNEIAIGFAEGNNGAMIVADILNQSTLEVVASFFVFFAIITSFLGVSLSLSDFLADGFKIKKTSLGKVLLCVLTFTPPFLFSIAGRRVFFGALEYAGAFGVVTLLGLLPALMVWYGRYKRGFEAKGTYRAPGGKGMLIMVMAVAGAVFILELIIKVSA